MGKRFFAAAVFAHFCVWAAAFGACADGLMIAEPASPNGRLNAPETLSVKKHLVSVEIEGQIATTKVDQVFLNGFDSDIEATYLFPVPDRAAISSFSLYINGRKTNGEVLEREQARKTYEEIVRKMRDPGLLEYVGRNLIRARVYPVPARGETRVELAYSETLRSDGGLTRYAYPLDTERFSPTPLEEVALHVHISSPAAIKSVYSPTHDVDVRLESREADVGFEAKDLKPDRDFVLYYGVSERNVGVSLLAYRAEGEDGYFALMISPGRAEGPALPKDIVFVLDTSGSMRGEKLAQAKRALSFCLKGLDGVDRFNVIQFSTTVKRFSPALVDASGSRVREAVDFVERLEARGGTNVNDALLDALRMLPDAGRPRMAVFMTDGEPTVSVTDDVEILRNVERGNGSKARIAAFGLGFDVNTHLLDGIAAKSGGFSDYVPPGEDIERAVSAFFRKVSRPVLSDLTLEIGGVQTYDLYPQGLPDLFSGQELLLFGRYTGKGKASISLSGTGGVNTVGANTAGVHAGGVAAERFRFEAAFPSEAREADFVPRLWAARKIGYLIDEIRLRGENTELVEEIVRLSVEHGIMTPYTSYLVLEKGKPDERLGLEPGGEASARERGRQFAKAMADRKGAESVSAAEDLMELKGRSTEPALTVERVKQAGAKTFYLRDGVWFDAEYREGMKTVHVAAFSGAYFELLREAPGMARYLAISKNLVLVFESVCYRITE